MGFFNGDSDFNTIDHNYVLDFFLPGNTNFENILEI